MPRKYLLSLLMVLAACASQAPSAAPGTAILKIDSVAPESLAPVAAAEPNSCAAFRIEQVSTANVDTANLHYYWYYDWDPGDPVLDTAAICQDKSTCSLGVCARPLADKSEHRLLVVVSSAALLATAVSPTDFPAGTAFDAVDWQIELKGTCAP